MTFILFAILLFIAFFTLLAISAIFPTVLNAFLIKYIIENQMISLGAILVTSSILAITAKKFTPIIDYKIIKHHVADDYDNISLNADFYPRKTDITTIEAAIKQTNNSKTKEQQEKILNNKQEIDESQSIDQPNKSETSNEIITSSNEQHKQQESQTTIHTSDDKKNTKSTTSQTEDQNITPTIINNATSQNIESHTIKIDAI